MVLHLNGISVLQLCWKLIFVYQVSVSLYLEAQ